MTKDEAEILAIKAVGFEFSDDARRTLSILQALGMLSLDEPKGIKEKLDRAYSGFVSLTPLGLLEQLERVGLKLVEK